MYMRALIILIVSLAALLACAIEPEVWDYSFVHDIEIASTHDAISWITHNVIPAHDECDYWQSPEETYNFRQGDCEDMCILFMYLIHEQLGMDSELHILQVGNDEIYHAVVWSEGIYYNVAGNGTGAPGGMVYEESYNYGRTMWLATVYYKE